MKKIFLTFILSLFLTSPVLAADCSGTPDCSATNQISCSNNQLCQWVSRDSCSSLGGCSDLYNQSDCENFDCVWSGSSCYSDEQHYGLNCGSLDQSSCSNYPLCQWTSSFCTGLIGCGDVVEQNLC